MWVVDKSPAQERINLGGISALSQRKSVTLGKGHLSGLQYLHLSNWDDNTYFMGFLQRLDETMDLQYSQKAVYAWLIVRWLILFLLLSRFNKRTVGKGQIIFLPYFTISQNNPTIQSIYIYFLLCSWQCAKC